MADATAVSLKTAMGKVSRMYNRQQTVARSEVDGMLAKLIAMIPLMAHDPAARELLDEILTSMQRLQRITTAAHRPDPCTLMAAYIKHLDPAAAAIETRGDAVRYFADSFAPFESQLLLSVQQSLVPFPFDHVFTSGPLVGTIMDLCASVPAASRASATDAAA